MNVRLLPLAFFAGGTGCGFFNSVYDTSGEDSGGTNCDSVCVGELVVQFADGRADFQIQLYGEGFPTLNLACPDDVAAGGVGAAGCLTNGFFVEVSDYAFPEVLQFSVDGSDPGDLTPEWIESNECGTRCTSADVTLDFGR
jgi:hypothetical protein